MRASSFVAVVLDGLVIGIDIAGVALVVIIVVVVVAGAMAGGAWSLSSPDASYPGPFSRPSSGFGPEAARGWPTGVGGATASRD
jgi:hypothetical protein